MHFDYPHPISHVNVNLIYGKINCVQF